MSILSPIAILNNYNYMSVCIHAHRDFYERQYASFLDEGIHSNYGQYFIFLVQQMAGFFFYALYAF